MNARRGRGRYWVPEGFIAELTYEFRLLRTRTSHAGSDDTAARTPREA